MEGEDGCADSGQGNKDRGWWIVTFLKTYLFSFLLIIGSSSSYFLIAMIITREPCWRGSFSTFLRYLFDNVLIQTLHIARTGLILSLLGVVMAFFCNLISGKIDSKEKEHVRETNNLRLLERKKDRLKIIGGKFFLFFFFSLFLLFVAFGLHFNFFLDSMAKFSLLLILNLSFSLVFNSFVAIISIYAGLVGTEKLLGDELLKGVRDAWEEHGEELVKTFMTLSYIYISLCFFLEIIGMRSENEKNVLSLILFVSFLYIYKRFLNIIVESTTNHLIFEYLYSKNYVERKKEIFGNAFYRKYFRIIRDILGILIVLLVILIIFTGLRKSLLDFIKVSVTNYAVSFAVGIPLLIYLAILLIDPFREGETILFGEKIGKVVKLNPLFTQIVTLENEKIYVPNALLLAKHFSRLDSRNPRRIKVEMGLLVNFSATLGYNYTFQEIEEKFGEVLKNIKEEEKKCEESELKKFIRERVLVYRNRYLKKIEGPGIRDSEFKEDFLCFDPKPFVSLRDFKDHGIEYNFNFYVKKPFFLTLIRTFIMRRTFETFEKDNIHIMTPLQFEYAPRTHNIEYCISRHETQEEESRKAPAQDSS